MRTRRGRGIKGVWFSFFVCFSKSGLNASGENPRGLLSQREKE